MRIRKSTLFLLTAILIASSILAQPTISSFSPASGPVGTSVTFIGTNFSTTPSNNIVFFGAMRANVSSATTTSLTVTVPAGTTYQPITVTVSGLTGYSSRPFVITFPGGGQINSTSFGEKQDFVTGISPNAITLSDFDGDGKSDIATPNNNLSQFSSVSVLRNTSSSGNITFAPKQDYATGQITYAIASGDIDGDGKPDMVSTSAIDATFSIFRNTSSLGNISFAPKIDIGTGNAPFGVVLGDIDRDGKSDVVTLNSTAQTISVFRNIGSPGSISFAAKIDFSTLFSPDGITLGDFDGDGKTDIAFTNEASNSFSVYRNISTSGNVSFASRIDYPCGSGNEPYGISVGDLDNDSKLDLAVVFNNTIGGGIQLFRNLSSSGIISFAINNSILTGGSSNTCYFAGINDINGDGKLDIALSVSNSISGGVVKVFQNNTTTGTFSFGSTNNFFSLAPYGIMLGDLQGDGKPELITSEFTSEEVSVLKNRSGFPNISFINPTSAAAGASVTINGSSFTGATSVTFGGLPATSFTVVNATTITAVVGTGGTGDVVVTTPIGTGSIAGFTFIAPPVVTLFNPTTAGTGMTVTITGSHFTGTTAVSFGGITATSYSVINSTTINAVVGGGASGNVNVTNAFGTGSKTGFTYQPPPSIISFTPVSGSQGTSVTITGINFNNVQSVTVGGLAVSSFIVNSTTSITAVVGEGATGNIKVTTLWGVATSSANYSYPAPVITSFSPLSGPVGINITITGSNFRSNPASNYVYFGATRATVISSSPTSLIVSVPVGATYQPISVSVNNHSVMSKQFFVTTYTSSNTVITSSSFGWSGGFAVGEGPRRTVLADIDGDGKSDIITGNFTSRTVSVIRNTSTSGTISFAAPVQLTSGLGTQVLVATADMNGDGKLDIAVTGNQSLVSVLLNTSTPGAITFSPRVNFTALEVCRGIALGDFDGDAKTDIAVSTGSIFTSGHFISVFRNTGFNGEINFASRVDISITGTPHDVRAADMDNDNKTDLVIGAEEYMGVMRNIGTPGTITFNALQTFGPIGYYVQVVTGDVDGDNMIDVLSVTYPSANISAFRNTSTIGVVSLASPVAITGYANTHLLRLGQLNGDDKPDLIILPPNDKKVYVKRNESSPGTIAFSGSAEFAPQLTDNWVGDAAIGDIEGDNKTDFVVTNTTDNKVSIFRNRSGFPTITSFTPSSAGTGGVVQINGTDFTGVDAVRFGNVSATSFSVLNSTTITATVGSGSSGFVFIGSSVGADSLTGFTFLNSTPSVNSFTPTNAASGATITITGTNFTGATAVSFGGVAATSFVVNSSTGITAVVASGASGNVSVTTPGGTATLAGFTFIPAPVISSFTPTSAATGATITITGANFTGATAVRFGGVAATSFVVNSSTSIIAVVASGASGNVSVTTPGGIATLAGFTFIPAPVISSFTPTNAATGATITITGTNFTGATTVNFGGVAATSFLVNSSTSITAIVASGASGNVSLTTPGGTTTLAGFTFIPTPVISSFTPTSAATGATITITGTNFTGATAVNFGGVAAASFVVNSSASITAIVGAGATGNITVTTPGGIASASGFIYNSVTGIGGPGSINSSDLTVNPNPAKDFLIIKHPATNKNAELNFYDILGRKVRTILPARNSRQTDVILNYMIPGIYTIVWSDGTRVLSRIIVIN